MAPHKSNKRKRVTEVEDLPWIMGADGIEEVEGVEVVRNGDKVEFVVAKGAKRVRADDGGDEEVEEEVEVEVEADEWNGFEEDDDETTNPEMATETEAETNTSQKTQGTREQLEKPKKGKKEKKEQNMAEKQAKGSEKTQNPTAATKQKGGLADSATDFSALAALGDGERDPDVDVSAWLPLSLSPDVVAALARLRFPNPTPIQAAAIPEILEGKDVIGKASTGSGKTLAFAIPIVERWLELREGGAATGKAEDKDKDENEAHVPIALVLSPTRELAHQITKHIIALCAPLPSAPRVCAVTGGLSIHKQQRQLARADIVVGTPGRLWEVIDNGADQGRLLEAFKRARFLVVDEADRLLSEGHFKEAEEIIAALDKVNVDDDGEEDDDDEHQPPRVERQTLVFSATFNKNLQQKLAGKGMHYDLMDDSQSMEYLLKKLNFRQERPRFIDVNPISQMADGLREGLIECGAMEKDLFLYAAILLSDCKRILVFTNSITAVRRLTPMLQLLQIPAQPLHSQMAQKARLRSLERFQQPNPTTTTTSTNPRRAPPLPAVLIATDVAARGLDIPNIDAVVHYHVPRAADAYVHRSGRTARGSASGQSILLCAPDEVVPTRRLAAKVHAQHTHKKSGGYMLHTLDVDRRIASRLKERITLAKKIADADLAKEKGRREDDWVQTAADELGVDLDDDDGKIAGQLGWTGRGGGRKRKEEAARGMSKAEVGVLRARLREALGKRVNAGVSERYVAGGAVDVAELLRDGVGGGLFLGKVDGLGM